MAYDSIQNLEAGIDQYLMDCYGNRTAARANELARFLGISHRGLTRLCNRLLGAAPRASMRIRQLSYAASLLRCGTIAVDEIGVMAGFGDRSVAHHPLSVTPSQIAPRQGATWGLTSIYHDILTRRQDAQLHSGFDTGSAVDRGVRGQACNGWTIASCRRLHDAGRQGHD